MKGIVYNIFSDLVTEKFGMDVWDQLIDRTNPESDAIYTSAAVYPDGELIAYVTELSAITDTPVPDLVRAFGTYTMHRFKKIHPEFLENHTAKSFLESVHNVIHVEVKKLHPDTLLPRFEYESDSENHLRMKYTSPRKLCHLAEGLIAGAAEIFSEPLSVTQSQCMHEGSSSCHLEVQFG